MFQKLYRKCSLGVNPEKNEFSTHFGIIYVENFGKILGNFRKIWKNVEIEVVS